MFCNQCEQTAKGKSCTVAGSCGKGAATAALQDILTDVTIGVSTYAHLARELGSRDQDIDRFAVQALYSTVTNVNFDPERLQQLTMLGATMRGKARALYEEACVRAGRATVETRRRETPHRNVSTSIDGLVRQGEELAARKLKDRSDQDVISLKDVVLYSLKGAAAYAYQASGLGKEDDKIYAGIHEGLSFLAAKSASVEEAFRMCLKSGELNLRVMGLLDAAHTETFGHPQPTRVRVTPVKGKAILVSGHDLKDLQDLLEQTEGKGINVYTHGEMLPAHGYPKLQRYRHLVGNYGGAWQNQRDEFDAFPGAILMTTNCIQRPRDSYRARIFTSDLVAWPGVEHVRDGDYGPVIRAALAAPGFLEDGPDEKITVGFGHNAVLGVADKVIRAVQSGAIRHFFLIGGCDGSKDERGYFTELAKAVPKDCVILTLACGKYRFNKLDFGEIDGIPRLLDIGQCNDAYSAIQIALALAKAFDCGVNELPLSLILSWYEQKAVAILMTLLHLGIKNIRLGPSLPAFISPNVLKILAEEFNVMPISAPREDLVAILGEDALSKAA